MKNKKLESENELTDDKKIYKFPTKILINETPVEIELEYYYDSEIDEYYTDTELGNKNLKKIDKLKKDLWNIGMNKK